MSFESEEPSVVASSETRPLWIIAISLAAIAICLLLITIRIQLDRRKAVAASESEVGTVEVSLRKPDRPPVQRRNFERPKPETPVETMLPTPALVAPTTNIESAFLETNPAYGGFAAELSALPGTNSAAGIIGRVVLRGSPPVEPAIEEGSHPPCSNQLSNAPINPVFKVGSDGSLADVIVAIAGGLEGKRFARPLTNHLWTFKDCQVFPHLSVIRSGQPAGFVSANEELHLIQFAGSRVRNPWRIRSRQNPVWTLPQSTNDLVQLSCVQHPWEAAYFARFDHPFFAITDTNGNFAIPRMPAGNYTLRAMHRGLVGTNDITQMISVRDGENSVVNFLIDAPGLKMSTQNLSAQR